MKIRICFPEGPFVRRAVSALSDDFRHFGLETEPFPFRDIASCISLLLRGDADVAAIPLSELPATPPKGTAIAALSARGDAAWAIVTPSRQAGQAIGPFGLMPGSVVCVLHPLMAEIWRSYFPNMEIIVGQNTIEQALHGLAEGRWDAIGVPKAELDCLWDADTEKTWEKIGPLAVTALYPGEFVPPPGAGVVAYLSAENNHSLRNMLSKLHHTEVARLTNNERKLTTLLPERHVLGAFSESDARHGYHLTACIAHEKDGVHILKASSPTYVGLAEQLVQQVQAEGAA